MTDKINEMKMIDVEKITLNMGLGNAGDKLDKAVKLLQTITKHKPVKTITYKRIPTWNIRPGLPIGCKVTLRGREAKELLLRLFQAVGNTLSEKQFDDQGNVSFGVKEYIEIPGVNYDPDIGIVGFDVAITLKRPGLRVTKRKIKRDHIHKRYRISKENAIDYMKKEFKIKIGEE